MQKEKPVYDPTLLQENVQTDYKTMCKLVARIVGKPRPSICFSMFEDIDCGTGEGAPWIIKAPDLESPNFVFDGPIRLWTDYWRVTDNDKAESPTIEEPTWANIICAAEAILADGDGCGVFLEGLHPAEKRGADGVLDVEMGIGS